MKRATRVRLGAGGLGLGMFTPGRNMAMKVPPHQVDDTIRFYRDVLGLADAGVDGDSVGFHFGDKVLWIDASRRRAKPSSGSRSRPTTSTRLRRTSRPMV